jgi:hypothetical protein
MTEGKITQPLDLNEDDLAGLRQRYTARDIIGLFQALKLPVCDDHSAINNLVEREQGRREQDSFSPDPTLRQEAAVWLTAARYLTRAASRRELLLQVQEEVNSMLGFRLERHGQSNKPYTPETRADLKAAAMRGFALSDDLAERFLRAFEHGGGLRFGVRVPVVLRGFSVRAVAEETFGATLTTLLPPVPAPDAPEQTSALPSQHTAPMPAIRPRQPVTKINAPPPGPARRTSGPILLPEKAVTRLVLKQTDQPDGQNNLPGEWLLTKDTTSIGRMPESDLCFAEDKRVSRQHAVIHRAPTAYILTDLNSANGTYLNGSPLTEPAVLHSGDTIRVGHTELSFQMEPLAPHSGA